MRCATLLLLAASALAAEAPIILPAKNADPDGKVGERPYEMVWAKRKPAHAETLDFEDLGGWTTASFLGARAELFRSREEQMFGTYTGKVAYTGQTATSYLELRPPKPILIAGTPQAVQLWVRGNNWGWYPKPKTARTYIRVVVQDAKGEGFDIDLGQVNFDYWFLMHARFVSPTGNLARISPVRSTGDGKLDYPLSFVALRVSGCSDKRPAKLSFDSLQFYTPDDKPLAEPKLPPTDVPWPTTPDTITPTPKESVRVSRSQDGPVHIFTASGRRDRIRWSYLPKTGTLDDLTVEINGKRFRPCVGGGPVVELGGQQCRLSDPGVTARPVMLESRQDSLKAVFEVHKGDEAVQYAYEFRASGKSLQITVTEELAYHPSQVQVDRKRTIVT
ncbi:MAG: hypothetical protein ISS72_02935, partial [Candidatus Brocadiae bacterium]|nr:hypothetical protein [Candidatus Brocadiia bacterium]